MSALMRAALAATTMGLVACGGGGGGNSSDPSIVGSANERPAYVRGTIDSKTFNGTTDDLLTAGLGKAGLAGAAPAVVNTTAPTVAELRRLAIYNNYRALVDIAANGGYGTLYGPNVAADGTVGTGSGMIAGEEHIAYADDGTGRQNVTMMVQIPSTFSTAAPCIIAAPSSGSRGVYGAIGTAGEWGLKRGCAVAYTDKGNGNGGHDLGANGVNLMLGQRAEANAAGANSQFTANLTAAELAAFNGAFPNRWAYKHAHSQQNPEADWGRDTLRAIEFAFYMINQTRGNIAGDNTRVRTFVPANTLVIASSVSNGAGASLAAAEQDTQGLIDGVAVAEPQVVLNAPAGVTIRRGANAVPSHSRPLLDYFTIANLYQPCATVAPALAGTPGIAFVNATLAGDRCAALAARGLVTGSSAVEQGTDALNRLLQAGWEAESIPFQASHYAFATLSVTLTYANAFARASVRDNLCGYSFGATPVAGVPPPLAAAAAAQLFGTGNGVPPTSGINIVNNNSVGGAAVDAASVSPSTRKLDYNIDGAVCLRELYTSPSNPTAIAVRANIDAIKRNGNLRGKPGIIVHGRSDTLVIVNHTSRPYYALNKIADANSRLTYVEVTNAQHFDAFIGNALLAGYDTRLVPLHRYFNQAMDLMYNHLRSGEPLPPSQVVRTTPRGGTPGAAPLITTANVPPIAATPAAGDMITFSNNTLTIPD